MKIKDNIFKIKFDNDYIYLDNRYVNLASKYSKEGDILNLNIYSLYLKDLDFLLLGSIKLDFDNNILNFFGKYQYAKKIEGELNIQANKKELDFFVNSGEVDSLNFLKQYVKLDPIAEAWMYDNVKGKLYLDHLYGKIDLKTFTPILKSIKGYARVVDAKVKFHNKLDVVKTPLINLEYQNDNLLINLKEPTYKGISVDGSFVDIKDMTSLKYGHVDVTIKANHLLDNNVLEILKAHKINLPLKQLSGKTDAIVHLYIPYDAPMKTFGVFKAKDSTFKINNFEFYSKSGTVDLINRDVIIKDTDFVHKNMINAKVNLKIDTKTLKSQGNAYLNSFLIKSDKQEIVKVKDKKVDISLDFAKTTKLSIDDFKTDILFKPEFTDISIGNLEKIYPYSKLLQEINIKKGDIDIKLYDVNNIKFLANLYDLKTPLKKDSKRVDFLKLNGEIANNKTLLSTMSNDLKIDIFKDKINLILNGYDVDLTSNDKNSFDKDFSVRLIDSNIFLPENSFYSIDSIVQMNKKAIFFDGKFGKLDLPLEVNAKKVDTLSIKGSLENGITKLQTKDKKLKLNLNNNNLDIKLNGMDLIYNSNEPSSSKYSSIKVDAKNSNINMNNKHKILANSYKINITEDKTNFDLKYKKATIKYIKAKDETITLNAKNIDDSFVNSFFGKKMVEGGTLSLSASGKDDFISGRMDFNKNNIMNLAILNNLITLVNTTPALINPLLAVPAVFGMVTNDGFNLNGYSVNEGYVEFTYNFENSFLNLTKIHTIGNSVDFDGYATIDLQKSLVDSKIELVFMKDYSKIVNYIPGLSYIFLGDDKRVSTTVDIKGNLDDPKIESNIAKDSVSVPINILKRIITSPFKLFEKSE